MAKEKPGTITLQFRADLRQKDRKRFDGCVADGFQETHWAAMAGDVDFLKDLLTKQPELVNQRTKTGLTALHMAADNGKVDCVSFLVVQDKVAVNTRDIDGNTALHLAAIEGHTDSVSVIIASGKADVHAKNKDGNSIWDVAKLKTVVKKALKKNSVASITMLENNDSTLRVLSDEGNELRHNNRKKIPSLLKENKTLTEVHLRNTNWDGEDMLGMMSALQNHPKLQIFEIGKHYKPMYSRSRMAEALVSFVETTQLHTLGDFFFDSSDKSVKALKRLAEVIPTKPRLTTLKISDSKFPDSKSPGPKLSPEQLEPINQAIKQNRDAKKLGAFTVLMLQSEFFSNTPRDKNKPWNYLPMDIIKKIAAYASEGITNSEFKGVFEVNSVTADAVQNADGAIISSGYWSKTVSERQAAEQQAEAAKPLNNEGKRERTEEGDSSGKLKSAKGDSPVSGSSVEKNSEGKRNREGTESDQGSLAVRWKKPAAGFVAALEAETKEKGK